MAKVLIVDREPNARDVVSTIVEVVGYESETAADRYGALARFQPGAYDAAIVDFWNGLELVRSIRERDPAIFSIMLTGDLFASIEFIEALGLQVLPKPTTLDFLMTTITATVTKTRLARQNGAPPASPSEG